MQVGRSTEAKIIEFNGSHQLLINADDIFMLAENINTKRKNTGPLEKLVRRLV
jgi:hypothetical protein